VLAKVVSRQLDTNLPSPRYRGSTERSTDQGGEKNTMPGKILVYPSCRGLKSPRDELGGTLPLEDGHGTSRRKMPRQTVSENHERESSGQNRDRHRRRQGLGQAISQRLAREGCQVVIADVNETGSRHSQRHRQGNGPAGHRVKVDVTQEADVKALFDRAMQEFGCVDIVVSNAAILIAEPIADGDAEKWRAVMNVNLFGISSSRNTPAGS